LLRIEDEYFMLTLGGNAEHPRQVISTSTTQFVQLVDYQSPSASRVWLWLGELLGRSPSISQQVSSFWVTSATERCSKISID
jgi:hypothetical protein